MTNIEIQEVLNVFPSWLQEVLTCPNLDKYEKKQAVSDWVKMEDGYMNYAHYEKNAPTVDTAFQWLDAPSGVNFWAYISDKVEAFRNGK